METSKITVLARIRAKPGQEEKVRDWALSLMPLTRAEPGCINYDLHQDISDPALFVFFENFKDQAAFDAHANAPYVQEFITGMKTLAEAGVQVNLMRQIA